MNAIGLKPRTWLVVSLFVTLDAGSNRWQRIIEYDKQSYEQVYSAPLVIVGIADSARRLGPHRPSRVDPRYPMQLWRVRVHVENVLRGSIQQRTVFVYYFALAGGIVGPRPLGFGREPSRRILWLRKDAGVLRMACDGRDICSTFVESGAHTLYALDPRKPIGYALGDILFTRGEGQVNEDRFARTIQNNSPVPEEYLMERLKHLALTEGPVVKAAACLRIWIYVQDMTDGPDNMIRRSRSRYLVDAGCPADTGAEYVGPQ
jgi:hypothetical protein